MGEQFGDVAVISDAELMRLPDDAQEAFVAAERIARDRLDAILGAGEYRHWDHELEYMGAVLAAARFYEIEGTSGWEVPHVSDPNVGSTYKQFRLEVSRLCTGMRLGIALRLKLNAISFDPATKKKLRHLLDQMRAAVDEEKRLTQRKRDALYARIADLSKEVDCDWSRSESYGNLAIEVADMGGEAIERVEPLRKLINSVGAVFGKARREQDEQARLPPRLEPKRIEPPKPKPASLWDKKIDDEIPF